MSDDILKRLGRIVGDKAGEFGEKVGDVGSKLPGVGGGAVSGALLGGLVGGPFGMIFGAAIGGDLGEQAKAKQKLEKFGLSKAAVEEAQSLAVSLQQAQEGYDQANEASIRARDRSLALEKESDRLYESAKAKLEAGDEDAAKALLTERQQAKQDLEKAVLEFKTRRSMMERIESEIAVLKSRVEDFDNMLLRAAKAAETGSSVSGLESYTTAPRPVEDPLLKKFEELERKSGSQSLDSDGSSDAGKEKDDDGKDGNKARSSEWDL